MSKDKANVLDFYDHYAKKDFWSLEETVALTLNINPKKIVNKVGWLLQDEKGNTYKKEFRSRYDCLKELINDGLLNGTILSNMKTEDIAEKLNMQYYLQAEPLSYINWCKTKDTPFPVELEKLVIKYRPGYIDWEAKCKKLESRIQELEAKNTKLVQEASSVPHIKRLNSWQKGFIGMLAVKYGHERLLRNFGNIYNKPEISDKMKLTFAKIRDDLNREGIIIDDEVIKGLIQESIKYLSLKSQN